MKPTLQTIRQFHKLSYAQLARTSGLRPVQIYRIEQGYQVDQNKVNNIVLALNALTGQRYRPTDIAFNFKLTTICIDDVPTIPEMPIVTIPETPRPIKPQGMEQISSWNNHHNTGKRQIVRPFRYNPTSQTS